MAQLIRPVVIPAATIPTILETGLNEGDTAIVRGWNRDAQEWRNKIVFTVTSDSDPTVDILADVAGALKNSSNTKVMIQDWFITSDNGTAILNFQFGLALQTTDPFNLTGNTDDLAINPVASIIKLTANANCNLTGMTASTVHGKIIMIENADTTDTITIKHDTTSTTTKRFLCPNNADFTLTPRRTVWAIYDSADARWRIVG